MNRRLAWMWNCVRPYGNPLLNRIAPAIRLFRPRTIWKKPNSYAPGLQCCSGVKSLRLTTRARCCNAFRRRFGRGVHAGDAPRHTPLKRVYECFLYPALQGSIAFLESQFANDCGANGHRFVVFGDFRLGAAKTYAGLSRSFLYAFSDSRPDHDERAAKRFRE